MQLSFGIPSNGNHELVLFGWFGASDPSDNLYKKGALVKVFLLKVKDLKVKPVVHAKTRLF